MAALSDECCSSSLEHEELNAVIEELSNIPVDPPSKRELCNNCSRPVSVCWCAYLPVTPLNIKSKLIILQHPSEEKRCLRTAKILELSLASGRCKVIKGKKFSLNKNVELRDLVGTSQKTLLLFPSTDSVELTNVDLSVPHNVVIIDGTWSQARAMYNSSPDIHSFTKVEINVGKPSNYVIRTQPTEECLSTVETAAITLSYLESNPNIYEILTKPLEALCSFQLKHGAVHHFSKEYLILNGLYKKPITRRIKKKLRKHQDIKNYIR
ncbi:DTW domain-containing protein 2-like protein [Leptotrombidium deliense]|uniref:tRNA-uridine aminocarboxypropyltransferase n=1 Tax=Leptotrombidium deliense TaxID=299467 RepID=A0A443SJ64_9ACAR|nr:DTW domain-containing protein 2-like protein [Leptotrombidium deliense]